MGGQASNFEELYRVNCCGCYRIDMPYWSDKIDCIKQWNARTPQSPALAQAVRVPDGYILVPRELTAENGAKSALIGEFNEEFGCLDEDGVEQIANVPVTWTTIKAIHKKMVAHFEADPPVSRISAATEQHPIYYRYRTKLHGGDWMVVLPGDLPKDKSGWEIEPLYGAPPQEAPTREALAEAWIVGHNRARGFIFTDIDIQGCKGSFLWGQAMFDAVALMDTSLLSRPQRGD
jgi:hypothetical protein